MNTISRQATAKVPTLDELRATVQARYGAAAQRVADGGGDARLLRTGRRIERLLRRDERDVGPDHRQPLRRRRNGRPSRRSAARLARLRQSDGARRARSRARRCSTSAPAAASTCCSRRSASGPTGKAYGLDMTDEMLALARENQRKAGATNVEFLKGTSRRSRCPTNSVDVIISNCVINLSADKDAVLAEAFRVLKPGGRFAVSDVVVRGEVPAEVRRSMELWVGCVAGALEEQEFLALLTDAGFENRASSRRASTRVTTRPRSSHGTGLDASLADEVEGRIMSAFVRATKPGVAAVRPKSALALPTANTVARQQRAHVPAVVTTDAAPEPIRVTRCVPRRTFHVDELVIDMATSKTFGIEPPRSFDRRARTTSPPSSACSRRRTSRSTACARRCPTFIVAESGAEIVGVAGLEICCDNALLRSVAVDDAWRVAGTRPRPRDAHDRRGGIARHQRALSPHDDRGPLLPDLRLPHHRRGMRCRTTSARRPNSRRRVPPRPPSCAASARRTPDHVRYALISDIHANLAALDAVLADIDRRGDVDAIYHLGDLVGYSAEPNEVVSRLRERAIAGRGGELRLDGRHQLRALRVPIGESSPGRARARQLSLDTPRYDARDEAVSRRPAILARPASVRRSRERSASRPRPRHTDVEHRLLDGGPYRRVLPEDGTSRGAQTGGRDRVRPHAQALASRRGGDPLRQHGQRGSPEGWTLARRLRAARSRWSNAARSTCARAVRCRADDCGCARGRIARGVRRVSADGGDAAVGGGRVAVFESGAASESRAHALTHSRTHALTHSRTHALTHSRTHALTHSRTHALCSWFRVRAVASIHFGGETRLGGCAASSHRTPPPRTLTPAASFLERAWT